MKTLQVLVAFVLIVCALGLAGAQSGYTVAKLGDAPDSWASAVNDLGEILLQVDGATRNALMGYDGNPFEVPAGMTRSYGARLNSAGIAIGIASRTNPSFWEGYAWGPNGKLVAAAPTVKILTNLNDNGIACGISATGGVRLFNIRTNACREIATNGYPTDINNAGMTVGYSGGKPCVWRWDGYRTVLPLPAGATSGSAMAINDSNVVVGHSYSTATRSRPVIWLNGQVLRMADLGNEVSIEDLNNHGVACGMAMDLTSTQYPVIWKNGKLEKLPILAGCRNGWAHAINNRGVIVGECYDYVGISFATIWVPADHGH